MSLEELDADLDKALKEEPPQPRRPVAARSRPERTASSANGAARATAQDSHQAPVTPATSKNLAFPTRKCRKLLAMLGHRYPDVNFDLITDVAESDPWTIREAELTEVFGQLLDNAGKYAESQVNIFLAIKGNMLVFGVADDGPGVDPELTQQLGEQGFRVNEETPAGEGLLTVRRILDAHGGSLAFDRSRLGGLEAIAAIPGSPLGRNFASRDAYH
ncbi:ATP-binding protein [Marinobacter lacisalsi]|uniref:histidine kinase n=1 Tax=Marinobacter lacisalsi TaxID=475979 RepID=A0ABV8QHT3_9GAMM